MNKISKIIKDISESKACNQNMIEAIFNKSILNGDEITLFNWECPPRKIINKEGTVYVSYNLPIKKIIAGTKIDEYTELPRVITDKNLEIEALTYLKQQKLNIKFVKIIADTNPYFITPETLQYESKKIVKLKMKEFKKEINNRLKTYPLNTKVILFTDLIKNFKNDYVRTYQSVLKKLYTYPDKVLKKSIINQQLKRIRGHVGIKDEKWLKDFSYRAIATYAAEGVVFSKLTETKMFKNCVWLNNHEKDKRTEIITNCGLKTKRKWLPILYVKSN